jgi:hypothetical protein
VLRQRNQRIDPRRATGGHGAREQSNRAEQTSDRTEHQWVERLNVVQL